MSKIARGGYGKTPWRNEMQLNRPSVAFLKILLQKAGSPSLYGALLEWLLAIQGVERGSIWLKKEHGYLCVEASGPDSESIKGLLLSGEDPSLVGWVIEHGEMTIAQAGKDQRHNRQVEEGFSLKSNLILCFPLLMKDGSCYGAVEIIDTSARGDRMNLDQDYLKLLQTMVEMGAMVLSNSLEYAAKAEENKRLKEKLANSSAGSRIIGQSRTLDKVLELARNYARTDFPVLLSGESGTGKELFAREIHAESPRADQPFVAINCSAIPANLLESELFGFRKGAFSGAARDKSGILVSAQGGTVFLDEIGDMPLDLQAKLLRVLQEGEVMPLGDSRPVKIDIRIVSATNRPLKELIEEGGFREDLFFRLNVLPLSLPPLRERKDDIPLLLEYFMARHAGPEHLAQKFLDQGARQCLTHHKWPGNVRELENLVKYLWAVAPGPEITEDHLPPPYQGGGDGESQSAAESLAGLPEEDISWDDMERVYVERLLEKHKWNISRASREAGLKRSTFNSRIKKLGFCKSE